MTWTPVGSVAVGPQDQEVLVGSFSLEFGDDSIWVKVTQRNPPDFWTYSYGLLTWKSSEGQELGTIKVHGDVDSEVYKLGTGLPPTQLTGDLLFRPRSFNRRWIEQAIPPIWELDIEAQSGKTTGGGSGGIGIPATIWSPADTANARSTFSINPDGYARIKLDFQ